MWYLGEVLDEEMGVGEKGHPKPSEGPQDLRGSPKFFGGQ